jgi:hypothetical protein
MKYSTYIKKPPYPGAFILISLTGFALTFLSTKRLIYKAQQNEKSDTHSTVADVPRELWYILFVRVLSLNI